MNSLIDQLATSRLGRVQLALAYAIGIAIAIAALLAAS